jgi:predicted nucleic acid-binding Zn ribbon protein
MMKELVEGRREDGYRMAGGLFLFAGGDTIMAPCKKLPVIMERGPVCGGGINPTGEFQWVDGNKLVASRKCTEENPKACEACPMGRERPELARAGLLWIGEGFYKTSQDWIEEAKKMGASLRIAAVPCGFEVGKTWVFVAHRKVFFATCDGTGKKAVPAIFHAFRPTEVQYITRGTDTKAELEAIEARGITPIKYVPHVGLLE